VVNIRVKVSTSSGGPFKRSAYAHGQQHVFLIDLIPILYFIEYRDPVTVTSPR